MEGLSTWLSINITFDTINSFEEYSLQKTGFTCLNPIYGLETMLFYFYVIKPRNALEYSLSVFSSLRGIRKGRFQWI